MGDVGSLVVYKVTGKYDGLKSKDKRISHTEFTGSTEKIINKSLS